MFISFFCCRLYFWHFLERASDHKAGGNENFSFFWKKSTDSLFFVSQPQTLVFWLVYIQRAGVIICQACDFDGLKTRGSVDRLKRKWHGIAFTYLFTTISLYMRFICIACHWQNRQLASITPRITTWPFDRASANGFSWPIVHEGGRLHLILEPSVSTKNESEAKRSVVATARMVSEKGKDVTSRIPMY